MPAKDMEDLEISKIEARRTFLKNCAKYAAAMPPAISILVSVESALGATNNPNCSRLCAPPHPPDPTACKCDPEQQIQNLDPQLFNPEETNPDGTTTQ
jgi:hypothetical protein